MHEWLHILQLLVSLRVPLLGTAFLLLFPVIAFTRARTLLLGLFDQTPLSLFLVTLAVMCLSGTVADNAHLIATQGVWAGALRWESGLSGDEIRLAWVGLIVLLSLPILIQAVRLSRKQGRSTAALAVSAVLGMAVAAGAAWLLMAYAVQPAEGLIARAPHPAVIALLQRAIIRGGEESYAEHALAGCAFLLTVGVWIAFGIYGYFNLGKRQTVPALAALLMLVMMLVWPLAAATFYLDHWHVPTLLIVMVAVLAATSGWSHRADHTYQLIDLAGPAQPEPAEVLTATGKRCVIVAAAEGGGIQAAAWTAQVLEGLREACGSGDFDPALRMISGVSGGSVGTACYVDWLQNPVGARPPAVSAAKSSLDEVAWGLAWPDFLRAVCPWVFGWMIDRGAALQRAWSRNCSPYGKDRRLLEPLSGWRQPVHDGCLPGVVLNSTVVENGFRLLMGTSAPGRCGPGEACMDAAKVNRIGERQMDVSVVTAARLSATFTWVTPAARAAAGRGSRKPHLVDGGYYDNYGMATLVEWLDEALAGARGKVAKVLVVQIHSSPADKRTVKDGNVQGGSASSRRGWFFQMMAPALTLLNVRSSGQIAHNNIELELLQQKWADRGIQIESVVFEFPEANPPLSWHLTEEQKQAIRTAWDLQMGEPVAKVKEFLETCPVVIPTVAAQGSLENVPA